MYRLLKNVIIFVLGLKLLSFYTGIFCMENLLYSSLNMEKYYILSIFRLLYGVVSIQYHTLSMEIYPYLVYGTVWLPVLYHTVLQPLNPAAAKITIFKNNQKYTTMFAVFFLFLVCFFSFLFVIVNNGESNIIEGWLLHFLFFLFVYCCLINFWYWPCFWWVALIIILILTHHGNFFSSCRWTWWESIWLVVVFCGVVVGCVVGRCCCFWWGLCWWHCCLQLFTGQIVVFLPVWRW